MRRDERELLKLPSLFPPQALPHKTSQLGLSGFVSPHLLFVPYLAPFLLRFLLRFCWAIWGTWIGLFRAFNKRGARSELGSFVRPALGRTSTHPCAGGDPTYRQAARLP